MRYIVTAAVLLTVATISTGARAQSAPKLLKALKKELKQVPKVVVWGDFRAFRASNFYTPVKPILKLMTRQAQSGSKCIKHLSHTNVDFGVAALTPKSKNTKEVGYLALSGSFSATKFITCLARQEGWTKTTFKGYPAYTHKKDEFYYTPGMGSFVAVKGLYAKTVNPRKGTLGRGRLALLKGARFITVDIKNMDKKNDFKSMIGQGTLGGKITFKGNTTFHSASEARAFMKKVSPMSGKSSMVYALTKSLRLNRSGSRVTMHYTMDQTQLQFLVSMASMALSRTNKSAPQAPPPNTRIIP